MSGARRPGLPPSAVRGWVPWVGLLSLALAITIVRSVPLSNLVLMAVLVASYALPVLLLDILTQKRRTSPEATARHVGPRLAAHLVTFAVIGFAYWLFPYTRQWWLAPALEAVGREYAALLGIAAVVLTAAFVVLTRVPEDDSTVQVGRMLLAPRTAQWTAVVAAYGRSWLVKAFFLPLMTMFLAADMAWFRGLDWSVVWGSFANSYDFLFRLTYFLDVTLALGGYLLTFRWSGTHIRSAEPTTFGWLVCLICYPPFWAGFYGNFFAYENGKSWMTWIWDSTSLLHMLWGTAILLLGGIYLWATLAFGIRFSNLTHRGILTNGPYRFTKHPAYIAKNISWWMVSVPFLQETGLADALRLSLLLLCVNAIYYARAKTEERHLGRDPVYQAYAAWIARHGLLAQLRRLLPGPRIS